jgi:hypothetical protein
MAITDYGVIPQLIVDNVSGNITSVDGLVGQRFTNAYTVAERAWVELQSYLALIGKEEMNVEGWEPIEIEDTLSDIIASITGVRPEIDSLNSYISQLIAVEIPSFPDYQVSPTVEFSSGALDVNNALFTKLLTIIEDGGTGLGSDVEALIWARMRQRQEIENARQWLEAENYFAGRGFDLPPGALSGKLNEISIDIARSNVNTNNDITVEQARLAQTNTHFALGESYKATVSILGDEANRLVAYNKTTCDVYVAKLEGAKASISKFVSILDSMVKYIGAKVGLYQADISLGGLEIESKYKTSELKVRISIAQAEVKIKEMSLVIETAKNMVALRVEALKSAAQVLSQICASALTSVNASASMGISTSVGENLGMSYQQSSSHSESHTENINISQSQ